MGGGAWWAAVHGVAKSQTRLSNFTLTFNFHALEKEMATHSSVLAWRIPRTEEPGGLPSMGSHRVGHDWSDLAAAAWCVLLILMLYTSRDIVNTVLLSQQSWGNLKRWSFMFICKSTFWDREVGTGGGHFLGHWAVWTFFSAMRKGMGVEGSPLAGT